MTAIYLLGSITSGLTLLVIIFIYVYHLEKKRFHKLFLYSWMCWLGTYSLLMTGEVCGVFAVQSLAYIPFLLSGLYLAEGAYNMLDMKLKGWVFTLNRIILPVCIIAGLYDRVFLALSAPLIMLLVYLFTAAGIKYARVSGRFGKVSKFVGGLYIVFAVMYPGFVFFVFYTEVYPVSGFIHIAGALLRVTLAAAVSLLYFSRIKETLGRSEMRFRLLAENAKDVIFRYVFNPRPHFEYISPACTEITGYGTEEFYRDPFKFAKITHPDDREMIRNTLRSLENFKDPFCARIIHKNGSTVWFELRSSLVYDNEGEIVAMEGIVRDITEQKNAEQRIRYLSLNDKLTGLYNRVYMEKEMERLDVERQLPVSIIMCDANGLKFINDTFGHSEGDRYLVNLSRVLSESCRKEDIVARYGGDEFVLVLPVTCSREASAIVERIHENLKRCEGSPIPLSMAIGISTKTDRTQDINDVLKKAEKRMYSNKVLEKNLNRDLMMSSIKKRLWEKDYHCIEHERRLEEYLARFVSVLGLEESLMEDLSLMASLHDIGKIALPDSMLKKKGKLTDEETEVMKSHSEIGYRIARSIPGLDRISEEILSHHERWDGKGYPQGLKGKQIPVIARIFAIVDAFEVMTHERPYADRFDTGKALDEIRKNAGKQFEPHLVDKFITVFSKAEAKG